MDSKRTDRIPTSKRHEYTNELKFKALRDAWIVLKSVSEEMRSMIAEHPIDGKGQRHLMRA